MWRSFHFDENSEMLDSYVTHIRQVALLLGYGEPQVLDILENTLPSRLYLVLFPIEDLRQAVKTVKIIITIEKIDRQLVGQQSSIPFMNIQDGYNSGEKVVLFDTQDSLDDKLDTIISMISKLTVQGNSQNRLFNHEIDQRKRMLEMIIIKIDTKVGVDQMVVRGRAQYGQNYQGRLQHDQDYRGDFRKGNFRGTQNYRG